MSSLTGFMIILAPLVAFALLAFFILLLKSLRMAQQDEMGNIPAHSPKNVIKNFYYYLVSFVALMMMVFSASDLINLGLRTWVFTKANRDYYYAGPVDCEVTKMMPRPANDPAGEAMMPVSDEECAKQKEAAKKEQQENIMAQRQRDAVRDISLLVVSIPLFIFHWRLTRRKE